MQLGDFGIDVLCIEPVVFVEGQQFGPEPGLNVLAHHRQAVKWLGDHALQEHRRLGDEGQAGSDRLQKCQRGLPVGRDALQLIAKAARLGLRQDHLLGEVGQHRNDGRADLALHAFEDGRQAREVVVEDFRRTRHVFGHHQAQALRFFH